ncbi:MAG TPA: sugar ABC transporter substrate-binding protein [Candidatus Competibacteraceae bacterium]|nr:sugar ABC transporter substrate-binding protein [Candidatus Competibacteraceae bacterium]
MRDEIKASKRWKIAYLVKVREEASFYWARAKQGAETAGRDFNVDVAVFAPPKAQEDIAAQIKAMDALIHQGEVNGIIIAPVDTYRLAPVTEKAIAAGIPVIVHDTPLDAKGLLTFVVFDNVKAGRMLGQWVVGQLGGRGDVLILEGLMGHQNAIERRNGMLEGLRVGDINVLGLQSGRWLRGEARRITRAWLRQFPRVDAILAAGDDMALGAAEVVAEAHREGIIITGFDGNRDALVAIGEGRLHATIDQVPERLARLAVQLMVRHLETGETFPQTLLWSDIQLITQDNIARFLP